MSPEPGTFSSLFFGSPPALDRKSTRLNSSHVAISYAAFCLQKKHRLSPSRWGRRHEPVNRSSQSHRRRRVRDSAASVAPHSLLFRRRVVRVLAFFFNDTATTEIYTLSLHDALPISAFPPSQFSPKPIRPGRRRT